MKQVKLKKLLVLTAALTAGFTMPASAQDASLYEALETVQLLSQDKQFGRALGVLSQVSAEEQKEYDYRFMHARVLTWSGNYSLADIEYASLMSEFPNNPDVMVSYGYLEYFRGNLTNAETYFNKVLDTNPTYLDAYDGLQRTYDMRRASKTVSRSALNSAVACEKGQVLTREGACTAS